MASKGRIILDCDPGEDDALALLLAIAKGLDLAAVICGFGNTSADKTYKNGAGLLMLADRMDIQIFKGAEKPYRTHPFETDIISAGSFVGENGLCGVHLPTPDDFPPNGADKAQAERINDIVSYLRQNGPMTYIVTGPCATLAHILDALGSDAKELITQLIVMGGALDTPGNTGPINLVTGKPYAEFNFYCDPHAVKRVFDSGIPITLVPWDLTEQIVLTYSELDNWQSDTPQGSFVLKLMCNFLESYGNAHERSFEFNDCITMTAFEEQGSFRTERIRIILEGEQSGRLLRDAQGTAVRFFELAPEDILKVRNDILSALDVRTS